MSSPEETKLLKSDLHKMSLKGSACLIERRTQQRWDELLWQNYSRTSCLSSCTCQRGRFIIITIPGAYCLSMFMPYIVQLLLLCAILLMDCLDHDLFMLLQFAGMRGVT
ncbi:MAG: hypothetical protein ACI8RD_008801 [Bacillariaceae sp.]|jgi:hypothetical protein